MAQEFEGRGWRFPISLDEHGAIAQSGDKDKVRQSIETILRTAPGERVMRPDFGCGIHDLVFDAISGATVGRVAAVVAKALATWEPRIDVLSVVPRQDTDDPTRLLIEIQYRLRSSNSRFNLVFPFYVQ